MEFSRRQMIGAFGSCAIASPALAATEDAVILIDAEFGQATSTSAQAIELGVRVALGDIARSGILGTTRLTYRKSDNRGVPAIAVDNFIEAARDPKVVAVMGGKFSPVQLEIVPHAHKLGLMLLNPWGSADEITDHGIQPSWTFRVSLKDDDAASAFINESARRRFSNIGVILPNTAWGRSMSAALTRKTAKATVRIVEENWYNLGERSFLQRYTAVVNNGAQAVLFVANEMEGAVLAREIARLAPQLRRPVLCHWGITGGSFTSMAADAIYDLDWSVIQTFSFYKPRTAKAEQLATSAMSLKGAKSISDLDSAVGIAHGHDLAWLTALALKQAGGVERAKIRAEMERLPQFEGAVRVYDPPFTVQRHDALGEHDILFARFVRDKGLVPV